MSTNTKPRVIVGTYAQRVAMSAAPPPPPAVKTAPDPFDGLLFCQYNAGVDPAGLYFWQAYIPAVIAPPAPAVPAAWIKA